MTEKRKCGKPPIYGTPSVRLTVQIEATTMDEVEMWRKGLRFPRSVAVNELLTWALRGLGAKTIKNAPQPEPDGAKAGQPE